MKTIEILLQGECIPDIQLVEVDAGKSAKEILELATRCRQEEIEGEFLVFFEDCAEPVAKIDKLPESEDGKPISIHVHRCRSVVVTVTFNGVSKGHKFGPGTTIATVKKWAAVSEFGMKPADAAEHVLQFVGSAERPEPDTHIGALVSCPDCNISFDLVPYKRVEG